MAPVKKKTAPKSKAKVLTKKSTAKKTGTETAKATRKTVAAPPRTAPTRRVSQITVNKASISFKDSLNDGVLPVRLQSMVDKSEISDLLYNLARGLDRIDETLLRSVFHSDATLDMGPGLFQGGCHDYVHWVADVMGQVQESHHLIGNVRVTLEHDVAYVESYCHAHFRVDKPTGREDVFIGSRYLDRFERRPSDVSGVWKIVHRKQIIDWVRTEAVSDLFYHQNPDALWSSRTKVDPSYQMNQFPSSQTNQKTLSFLNHRYDRKSVKF